MAALLIKEMPDDIGRLLQNAALRHRRDPAEEALAILRAALVPPPGDTPEPPPVFRGRIPLTQVILDEALDEDRS